MRAFKHTALLCCILMVLAPSTAADVVNLTPVQDGTLFENDTSAASGSGVGLFVGRLVNRYRHAILEFDVAGAIPAGSAIVDVTLTLTVEDGPADGQPDQISLYRVQQDWGEGASDSGTDDEGAPAQPGDATWTDRFFPGDPWNLPGGLSPFFTTFQSVPASGPTAFSGGDMVDDVQGWLVDPASNHGWLLRPSSATNDRLRRLGSRESVNPAVLNIEFAPPIAEAGAAPNGASVPGEPLRLQRFGMTIDFTWGLGCRLETDFSLYFGLTGNFYDHSAIACTSGGMQEIQDVPITMTDGEYFLVVPVSTADNEGSHGFDGEGNERPRGTGPSCPRPQAVAAPVCP
jgi:hypothetical protein